MEPSVTPRGDPCNSSRWHASGTEKMRGPQKDSCNSSDGHTSTTDNLLSVAENASGCFVLDPYSDDSGMGFPSCFSYPNWPSFEVQQQLQQQPEQLLSMAVCKGDIMAKIYQEGYSSSRCQGLSQGEDVSDGFSPKIRGTCESLPAPSLEENNKMQSDSKGVAVQESGKKQEALTIEMSLTPLKRKVSDYADGFNIQIRGKCASLPAPYLEQKKRMESESLGVVEQEPRNKAESSTKETTSTSLNQKVSEMAITGTKRYYCKYCGKDFRNCQVLGGHMASCKQMAFSGPKKFYCKECGKDFPSVRSVGCHKRSCKLKNVRLKCARRLDLCGQPIPNLEDGAVLSHSEAQQTDQLLPDIEEKAPEVASVDLQSDARGEAHPQD